MHQPYTCLVLLVLVPTINAFILTQDLNTSPQYSSPLYQLIRIPMVRFQLPYMFKALLVAVPFHMA
jgi:hypothetical protein